MIKYLITSNNYYPHFSALELESNLAHGIQKGANLMCLRFRDMQNIHFFQLLSIFVFMAKKHNIVALINLKNYDEKILNFIKENNIGLHLKQEFLQDIVYFRAFGTFIIFSAHSIDDANKALEHGADFVTLSPIFYDKYNKALGIDFLQNLPLDLKKRTIALGGIINDENIELIKQTQVAGFASIRYFLQ